EAQGRRPVIAHCHPGLGKLYPRTGNEHDAQQHLATAAAMYREMDMRFWLEEALHLLHERSPVTGDGEEIRRANPVA
ncbi:MAG TPA: hypothetical protein VMS64_29740, partial [Candidatus Methylomirabilis sp.]|nr:hypothetical protein [Candidatus Methylomirabilis sp.]